MRLPASRRDNLFVDGASMRMWHDTRAKLRQLAALQGTTMAEALDAVVHEALEALLTKMEGAHESTKP